MACPGHCHCQWGWSGIFLGTFIILAAGVFTFFPVFLDLFNWDWYIALCWFWFLLGVALLTCGCFFEIFNIWKPKLQAREALLEEEHGAEEAPTPYIMIA